MSDEFLGHSLVDKYLRPENVPTKTCTGCGIGIVEKLVLNAMHQLELETDEVVWVMGVGCSSRQVFSTYRGDNVDALHGRGIPMATAMKLMKPDLKYLIFAGDGDLAAIGNNHLVHAARRNIDLTVIMMNNMIYGSTSGQSAPTTPEGYVTQTTPYGNEEPMYDVCGVLIAAGATLVARHTVIQARPAIRSIKEAIQNRGFSFVEMLFPCPTYFGRYALGSGNPVDTLQWLIDRSKKSEVDRIETGVLHRARRPEFSDRKQALIEQAQAGVAAEERTIVIS
jgi:2-oxoglutarate ferredoxin oxidoreductase subunit beta